MERLDILKKQLFDGFYIKREWWGDDLTILDREGVKTLPLIARKALAFDLVCSDMPLELKKHELIVGITTMSSVGFGHTFPRYETDDEIKHFAVFSLDRKSVWGHHMPYFPKVLQKGYKGIVADIDNELLKTDKDDMQKRTFLEAAKSTLLSAMKVPLRYAKLIRQEAQNEPSAKRKMEMLEIARICEKVPANPAESFHEALQSVWFVHMLLHSTLSYTPLGRVDQYLWPYYQSDMQKGTLDNKFARDLVGSFLIKFNERTQFLKEHMENNMWAGDWSQGGDPNEPTTTFDMENDADYTYGQSANHWLQSAVVGGVGLDGEDATNALSFMFIEVINYLELVSPMVGARLHEKSPKEFLAFVSKELCNGGSQPVLFNDDIIIKGLIEKLNIPPEDARDYSSDGCWEVLIYGRTEYSYGHIEVMPCMEALLNHGKSLVSGRMIGLDYMLDGLDTFDKFYDAYMQQVSFRIKNAIQNKIKYYDEVHKIAPEPYLSSLVGDCIENGRDLTDKGARYRLYALFVTGLSHCIDSLCAIKKLVYEDKLVTLEDVADALKNNWVGYEQLRLMCLTKPPKYGNDNDDADKLLTRFLNDFAAQAEAWNKQVDWLEITAGIATFENYPRFGHNAGASFDGRLAHEAFSSNYSPAAGRDKEGPTAVLLSATKFDLSRLSNGCPIDLRVSFNKETIDENRKIMQGFIESFVALGGNMMTITKVDYATLKKAQEEPEKYKSLRVRLGGVTAYFVQLAKAQQDEYMRRTEHAM